MIAVDSSVWIANLRRLDTKATRLLRSLGRTRDLILGDIVLLEILKGAKSSKEASELEVFFHSFDLVAMLDGDLAVRAAANYRLLRTRGITIRSTVDIIIGTYCIEHGHHLLQSDRDFLPMAEHLGLRLL